MSGISNLHSLKNGELAIYVIYLRYNGKSFGNYSNVCIGRRNHKCCHLYDNHSKDSLLQTVTKRYNNRTVMI